MWSSKGFVLVACLLVAGCGFEPLYGRVQGGGSAQTEIRAISIEIIKDRSGQILRNFLLDRLTPRGQPRNPRWKLFVDVTGSPELLGVRKTSEATRSNLWIRGSFRLESVGGTRKNLSGELEGVSSVDIQAADFGRLQASKDARERVLRQLADDIASRVAVHLRRVIQSENAS